MVFLLYDKFIHRDVSAAFSHLFAVSIIYHFSSFYYSKEEKRSLDCVFFYKNLHKKPSISLKTAASISAAAPFPMWLPALCFLHFSLSCYKIIKKIQRRILLASIEIFLLQSPKIIHDSSPCRLPYQKAEALLYYLAIEKRATREQAASLLWDQCDEAAARKNLRHAIFTVKKALGEECILPYGRQELILNPDISITLDYDQLIQEECTDVYHGEFLTSFYIKGAPAFEEWMLAKRHYALHTYLKLIYRRLSLLPDSDVEESERLFRLYMEEDPLDENIYRLMMERYRACGLYYKGLKLYDRMVHLFEKELSASPGKELQKLHHRMLDALNAERPVLQEAVEELPGREKELLFLSDAFQRFMGGESTSILLSGIDGSGKTYLAEYFTRNLSNSSFLILQASCL